MQSALGLRFFAIAKPDGELVADERPTKYKAPDWVQDPFISSGVATSIPSLGPLIGGRYLVVSTISESARGDVHLGVDIELSQSRILKIARHDALADIDGRDARDRLRHECEVLSRLAPDPRFPTVFDLLEEAGDLVLVMQDFAGETLEEHIHKLLQLGQHLSDQEVLSWGNQLTSILKYVHSKGLVYRDLKSSNCIVLPNGELRLIDFDISHECGSDARPYGRGTRGYMSPQQEADASPGFDYDIYGLGALLYFLLTGAEPSQSNDPRHLLNRSIALLNPGVLPDWEQLVSRCLDSDVSKRFKSLAELDAALAAMEPPRVANVRETCGRSHVDREARVRWRELARNLGNTLCRVAKPTPTGGLEWESTHSAGFGTMSKDINTGSSGTVLALASLVCQIGESEHTETLRSGALSLAALPVAKDNPLPGLYVGESGIATALLRAGQTLGDPQLIAQAVERSRSISTLPHNSPDLFNGSAGRVRFHLWLWGETGERDELTFALSAGEHILCTAKDEGDEALSWTIPAGYDGLSGQKNLGYAHGAAGIGCALLDLFDATGDERFLAGANGAAVWIARNAIPILQDESGFAWPANEGGPPHLALWCHGAAGIGRFFLHAAELDVFPDARMLAVGAARSVAETRALGSCQCHGLAGNIEFLLDMFQFTEDEMYLTQAQSLALVLESLQGERDGLLVWSSESPNVFTPDYMVGYAGVLTCLLRLSEPETLPHQLGYCRFRQKGDPRSIGAETCGLGPRIAV
jgi:serine/threonine protein kinase